MRKVHYFLLFVFGLVFSVKAMDNKHEEQRVAQWEEFNNKVDTLIEQKTSLKWIDFDDMSFLCKKSGEQYTNLLRKLLEHGFDPTTQNSSGSTPFICAAEFGLIDVVQLLLQYKVNPNSQNKKGDTALLCVVKELEGLQQCRLPFYVSYRLKSIQELVLLLLQNGANPYMPNNKGITSVRLASKKFSDIYNILIGCHTLVPADVVQKINQYEKEYENRKKRKALGPIVELDLDKNE